MALAKRRSCSASRVQSLCFFFFNDTATTEIYTLSLDDALPIFDFRVHRFQACFGCKRFRCADFCSRSEERFSRNAETDIVCRLLLEKKTTNRVLAQHTNGPTGIADPTARAVASASVTRACPPAAGVACASLLRSCPLCFFNDTATTEIYTLSLHDALPI